LKKTDEEIRDTWLRCLERMFPQFDRRWIRYFLIQRERYVEPLHLLNQTDEIPSMKTPVRDLFLATSAQIYPALTNGESLSQHARRMASVLIENQDFVRGQSLQP
jgi:hypothetical protein